MPITLNCACGKTLRVADEHAGKRVKCPVCNAVITPPAPEPQFEVVEEPAPAPRAAAKAKPVAKPRDEDTDDEGGGYAMEAAAKEPPPPKAKPTFRKRADPDDEDGEDERPRRRGSSAARGGADAGKRLGYMIGGVFLMGLGGFFTYLGSDGQGRGATKSLIFGILLIIGGLVMVVQGVTGNIPEEE
jgi:hypothetical protein